MSRDVVPKVKNTQTKTVLLVRPIHSDAAFIHINHTMTAIDKLKEMSRTYNLVLCNLCWPKCLGPKFQLRFNCVTALLISIVFL